MYISAHDHFFLKSNLVADATELCSVVAFPGSGSWWWQRHCVKGM
jgi:hypothetical protein